MITTIACSLVFVGAALTRDKQISPRNPGSFSTCCITDLTVTSNGHEFERAHNKLLELSNSALLNATNERLNFDRLSDKLRQSALASIESNINEWCEAYVKIINEMIDRITLQPAIKRDKFKYAVASCCTYYSQIMDHLVAVDNLISSFERKFKAVGMEKFAEEILPVITECKKVNMQIPPPDSIRHAYDSFTMLWKVSDIIIDKTIKTLSGKPTHDVPKYVCVLFNHFYNVVRINMNDPCLSSFSSIYNSLNELYTNTIAKLKGKHLSAIHTLLNSNEAPIWDTVSLMPVAMLVADSSNLLSRIISIFKSSLESGRCIEATVSSLTILRADIFFHLQVMAKYKCEVLKHTNSTILPRTEKYLKRIIENEKT